MTETSEWSRRNLRQWRKQHKTNRDPDICALRFKCEHLVQDGDVYRCALVDQINDKVREGIRDFKEGKRRCERKERITGRRWVLESFMQDAHNVGMCEDDYFPQHKVPYNCPFRVEFSVCQIGVLDERDDE